jgi:outer membrane cobalamin receptor
MSKSSIAAILWGVASLAVLTAAVPASAACFESGIGCTDDHGISRKALNALSCDALWTVRNSIFDENGYCFKTARGKNTFSNEDCFTSDTTMLKLNAYERANVARIVEVERRKGCR